LLQRDLRLGVGQHRAHDLDGAQLTVVATGRGTEIRELAPERCVNGHELRPPNVAVAHLPCMCAGTGGHRTYTCRTCDVTIYDPPHTDPSLSAGTVRGR
jgi:hypothetical protein